MWEPTRSHSPRVRGQSRSMLPDGAVGLTLAPLPLPAVSWMLCQMLHRLGDHRAPCGGLLPRWRHHQLARSAPHRVRVALVGTSCGVGSAPPRRCSSPSSAPRSGISPRPSTVARHLLDGGERFGRQDLAQRQAAAQQPPPERGRLREASRAAPGQASRSVETPTLVLAGAADPLVLPANGLLLARLYPNSRLHVLPAEGHLMLFDPASEPAAARGFLLLSPPERLLSLVRGTVVDDSDKVESALRSAPGAQPLKANQRRVPRLGPDALGPACRRQQALSRASDGS